MCYNIDGEIIQCTETHPFQVKGKGWVDASNLAPNDIVYTKNWTPATVQSVSLLELDEPVEVFNFEVEDCHTYFVGEQGILVHNSKCSEFKKIDPNIFESNNNLSKGTFHRTIKPKIISKVKPNYKVGYNPDIMLNKMGDIAYQGAKSKHFQETGLNIATILKELLG